MKTVYIETSIPSFYYETRAEPEMVARRLWTRHWWDRCASQYDLVTSEGVIAELQGGEYEMQAATLELIDDLPRLEVVDDIANIIDFSCQSLDAQGATRRRSALGTRVLS